MRRNFSVSANFDWRRLLRPRSLDRPTVVRIVLGTLLALNVAGLWFVFHPPGGSFEDLEGQIVTTRQQIAARQLSIERLHRTGDKTEQAKLAGEQFLNQYFLPRRHAYSLLEIELGAAARTAGIHAKDRTFSYEPVEGSDTLGMLSITASFEGTYADLITFVNQIDRAQRLLILESLQAQPIQGTQVLAITMKLDAFFRFEGPQDDPRAQAEAETAKPIPTRPVSNRPVSAREVRQ
jgi:Tfp pilus assembly protein PilO